MTDVWRPQPVPAPVPVWVPPPSGTMSLRISPRKLILGDFAFANPPPIPHLVAHTGVEPHLSYGWAQKGEWLASGLGVTSQ